MEKIKNNVGLIVYLLIVVVLTGIMFWAIGRKEGFHEDEMFSYGASNSTLGNTFLSYGRVDNVDSIIKTRNPFLTLKNYIHYKVTDRASYDQAVKELNRDDFPSIWRTRDDAIEYLQIDNFAEAMDFFSVYWNTAKDVHPPLFYFAVHIASILFWGHFSKYIIFLVNLIFFYGTIHFLRKILELIQRKHLVIPNLILYGASIGAISTVMFQRMYMMLTFFTVWFLYVNLKIYNHHFELDKKLKRELIVVTILGFLTQYNFCFYAALTALTMMMLAVYQKKKKEIGVYILQYVKAAIIGVLLFVPSIYHIFFSYRGAGRSAREFTMYEAFTAFCKNLFSSFSLPLEFGVILSIALFMILIWKFIKSNSKGIYIIFVIPMIITFFIMIAMSPYKSLRYIMFLLPIISMGFIILMDELIDNKRFTVTLLTVFAIYLSTYGLLTKPINYLYIGYQKYLDIAEEYQDDRFILVMPTVFSQIQDTLEFQTYRESLIIAPDRLEDLKEFQEFEAEEETILGIKNWIDNPEKTLEEVMEYTGFTNYELLHTSNKSARLDVYRLYK
ncbi:MAG: hypothetical protein IJ629_05260 [Clostridia bacterium]|nr:hypothetical protein [Clostridia bacterium]